MTTEHKLLLICLPILLLGFLCASACDDWQFDDKYSEVAE